MRTFVLGSGSERKFVTIETQGRRMTVVRGQPDGSLKRDEKDLPSESEAASASDLLARGLLARGYAEQKLTTNKAGMAKGGVTPRPDSIARSATATKKPASTAKPEEPDYALTEALEEEATAEPVPIPPRMAGRPTTAAANTTETTTKKPRKKRKKRKNDGKGQERLFALGLAGMSLAVVGVIGFLAWDFFFKPGTLIGTWKGSRMEYEISKSLAHEEYQLVLDPPNRAVLIHNGATATGTYQTKDNRLRLDLKDESDQAEEHDYKFVLSQTTLDLFDPANGKKVVQLIRMGDKTPAANVAGNNTTKKKAIPTTGELPQVDSSLATQNFGAKDGSFSCKYPSGWETRDGAAADNTFGWGSFEKGSAKIKVEADIAGSLMAGPTFPGGDQSNIEPPVERAHNLNKRKITDSLGNYQEGQTLTFTSDGLGEGRIAEFTAESGGLFSSKIHGYRATLLSNDRRVGILCQCPDQEWPKYQATFFTVISSISR